MPPIEEIRYLSGHNVISTIGAQLTEFRAELDTRLTRIEAEIKTQGARLDDLRQVIWRVDLAADRSTGRSRLRPALQGSHYHP